MRPQKKARELGKLMRGYETGNENLNTYIQISICIFLVKN